GSNRLLSAKLVASRFAPWISAGEKIIVLGDFKARRGARTLRIVEEAGISFPPVPGSTYHLNRGLNLFGAIDHIGLSRGVAPVGAPVVLRKRYNGQWPTDHYPVVLDISLPK
ncbi:MAG: endonuclease, partial [Pseudomonadota bacterium]